jgi:deazaflavin-dependent oxidoreductase (nitroreductase family)
MNDWTRNTIDDMREHGGAITRGPLAGVPALILTTIGARTGEPRTTLVDYTRDGDSYVIAASKGGAPTNPHWYHNLVANPRASIWVNGETFDVTARLTIGAERDRLYERHGDAIAVFKTYPSKTDRVIPVIVLDRVGEVGGPTEL